MILLSAGDLGVEIDYRAGKPSGTLQRKGNGHWRDYLVDGKPVTNPFDVETLPAGRYRLRKK
jgi:hypothetical protein